MNKLKELTLPQLAQFWLEGKLSAIELLTGLLPNLVAQQQHIAEQHDQLIELRQNYLALNLTLYQLKADVDSLTHRPTLADSAKK